MNYIKIYHSIINNRQNNKLSDNIYKELHHIIPKSLGGSDHIYNTVYLTAREHFICHYLLCKMYIPKSKEWYKMHKAFTMMKSSSNNQQRYFNSRLYESRRKYFSETQSVCQSGKNNSQYGTKKSEEQKNKISNSVKLYYQQNPRIKKTKNSKTRNQLNYEQSIEANELFQKYISMNYSSIGKFIKDGHYSKSKVNLTKSWKRYVPEYVNNVNPGKGFKLAPQVGSAPTSFSASD